MILLPTPKQLEVFEERFVLRYDAYIVLEDGCSLLHRRQAFLLQKKIEESTGLALHLTAGKARAGDILLRYDPQMDAQPESYAIEIGRQGVVLAGSEQGLFWAIQTFCQILGQYGCCLPQLRLQDAPSLPYRGYYHDVTRGRVPTLRFLKQLADKLSEYKLNQMQLYIENTYLFRDFSEVWRSDDPLTPEEIIELDDYCYERGIELVPSISTFSHLYQVLRTRQFSYLCELENSCDDPFDAWDKQDHHTIDITNPDSFPFVCWMIDECRPLFRTRLFNLCADETFDLGLGRSQEYCRQVGKDTAYVGFVKKLCDHLIEKGCRPMMWGDIIGKYPDLVQQLPKEMIYLNWGYSPTVKEDESRQFAQAQATFYNCPGVLSWSRLVNSVQDSYRNICRMAEYAHRFGAVGLLNTDWGDFHHICHPTFSFPGAAIGAQFGWSEQPMEYDELMQSISVLEFGQQLPQAASWIGEIDRHILYSWMAICVFYEYQTYHKHKGTESVRQFVDSRFSAEQTAEQVEEQNRCLKQLQTKLLGCAVHALPQGRERLNAYVLAIDGCCLFNQMGAVATRLEYLHRPVDAAQAGALAEQLENWLYYYKQLWRTVSKQSELGRIAEVLGWWADYLRTVDCRNGAPCREAKQAE